MTVASVAEATISQRLAHYLHDLSFDDLPAEVVAKVKDILFFSFGEALHGRATEEGIEGVRFAQMLSEDRGATTIIGEHVQVQPLDSAFANCSLMRARQMDEILFPIGVHAGIAILPVALALAERHHASGKDLVAAIVAGYDAIGKIGSSIWAWSSSTPRRPTIPFGPFGGAAAGAKVLGLDRERTAHALGYAAQSAMGLAESPWTHYYSLVARNGLMSALLAQAGGQTSTQIFEAPYGFFNTFFGGVPGTMDSTLSHLGEQFEILNVTSRRYPGTGLNILAIEQMREMRRVHGLTPENVARIALYLPTSRQRFSIGHAKTFPEGKYTASSAVFQVAMVLLDGETRFERYSEYDNPALTKIIDRIDVVFEECSGSPRYARVDVTTVKGTRHVSEGDTYTFPPVDGWATLSAGRTFIPEPKLRQATALIDNLESVRDVSELMAAFRPAHS